MGFILPLPEEKRVIKRVTLQAPIILLLYLSDLQ